MIIYIRDNAAACGVVFKVVKHSVHLVEIALGVMMLNAELISVSFADRAVLVRPAVPYMRVKVVYIIGFFLPYP